MLQAFNHRMLKRAGLISLLLAANGFSGCKTPNLTLTTNTPAQVLTAPLRQPVEVLPANGVVEVRPGDTLFGIASRYQVTPQSIIEKNGLVPPFVLQQGQTLKIIPRRSHVVTIEDTVYSISQRYAVSQYQLAQLNDLSPPFELRIGQRLQLPYKLDFSALDTGVPDSVAGTSVNQPVPIPVKAITPVVPRKRFVAPVKSAGGFRWPVEGEVIAEFGPSARGVHNDGINIAAASGVAVGAAAKGRVAFIGNNIKSFGKLILVKHDGGIITAYAHLGDIIVSEGDIVDAGQTIGTVGITGRVDQPQLHFEIRKSRQPIDPRSLISSL